MKLLHHGILLRSRWLWFASGLVALVTLALVGLHLSQSGAREVRATDLVRRDGLLFERSANQPFTGVMTEFYKDGSRKSRSDIVKGVLDGGSEAWSTNGVLQVREHFKNGVSHGLRTQWHANGTKLSETTIVEGLHEGTFRRWHENGQLAEQIELKQGQPNGVSLAFYPSGFLKAEALVRMGQVLEQKFWKDGESKNATRLAVRK